MAHDIYMESGVPVEVGGSGGGERGEGGGGADEQRDDLTQPCWGHMLCGGRARLLHVNPRL